uniref:Uncharacterized protein n=1 Tax=Cacopsylla melanoneura TaxID=428564 RepID=A0A8D8MAB2_9HEMI
MISILLLFPLLSDFSPSSKLSSLPLILLGVRFGKLILVSSSKFITGATREALSRFASSLFFASSCLCSFCSSYLRRLSSAFIRNFSFLSAAAFCLSSDFFLNSAIFSCFFSSLFFLSS